MANFQIQKLDPGLYFVATPIGTARDITLRTLDILASADVLAAEDTRSLRHLMDIHGIPLNGRRIVSYHDQNGPKARPALLAALGAGKSLAYAPEAGTALVADPGYQLARAAIAAGYAVTGAPGPSALLAALTIAGMPSDAFCFGGFLPSTTAARRKALTGFSMVPGTLIFYESPKRLSAMLNDAAGVLGGARDAAICRELTKKFEEVRRGTLDDLAAAYDGASVKGEIVVLIGRDSDSEIISEETLDMALTDAMQDMSIRDAAEYVANATGKPKREVYQRALALKKQSDV